MYDKNKYQATITMQSSFEYWETKNGKRKKIQDRLKVYFIYVIDEDAFGIGIIKLNADDIHDSEIVCPARYNENIDWDTLDRLSEDSSDFRKFISDLTEDIALGKVKSNYDKVISDEKFESYLKDKKIIK